ncbi:MAG TPA: STAS domain-containing protein [Candidatus Udaeobacter sp.]|nr:STAS domain-containing protein [Candidatus Udaeobacter sp.]
MAKKPSLSASNLVRHAPNVLPLKGELDLHVIPEITASLDAIIDKRPERLVVDLSDVSYIDSAGLAALIQAMQKVQAYGGQFSLAGLETTLRSIFNMSRLDEVFEILPKC